MRTSDPFNDTINEAASAMFDQMCTDREQIMELGKVVSKTVSETVPDNETLSVVVGAAFTLIGSMVMDMTVDKCEADRCTDLEEARQIYGTNMLIVQRAFGIYTKHLYDGNEGMLAEKIGASNANQ